MQYGLNDIIKIKNEHHPEQEDKRYWKILKCNMNPKSPYAECRSYEIYEYNPKIQSVGWDNLVKTINANKIIKRVSKEELMVWLI